MPLILIAIISVCILYAFSYLKKVKKGKEKKQVLLKVVEEYPGDGCFFGEKEREWFKRAVERGDFDEFTKRQLEDAMYDEEFANWCCR